MQHEAVLGFTGAGALAVTSHGVFLPAGNGIVVCRDMESFFWQPGSGLYEVHCIDACHSTGTLCVTERRRAVALLLFDTADLRKLQEVPDIAAVEVACVHFAPTGACLFVLCNVPTSTVRVLRRDRTGYIATHAIQLAETCNWTALHTACFGANSCDFVVLGDGSVCGYTCHDDDTYEMCMHVDEDNGNSNALLCIATTTTEGGDVYIGTQSGDVRCCHAVTQRTRRLAHVHDAGGVTALLVQRQDDATVMCVFATALGRVYSMRVCDASGDASMAPRLLCDVGSRAYRVLHGSRNHADTMGGVDTAYEDCLYIAASDGVYVCDARHDDCTVTALRRRTSGVVRCVALPSNNNDDDDDDTSVLVCHDGSIATYTANAVTYWRRSVQTQVVDACAVDSRRVVLVCRDEALRCCDVRTGVEVWCAHFANFRPKLCAADGHGMLVCCDDACVRFFVAHDDHLVARGLLHANVTSAVTMMRWLVDTLFLVACGNGELFLLTMPPPCDADTQHAVEDVALGMWRLDFPVVDVLPCFVSDDVIHLLAHSVDKDTKLYAVERRRDAEARVLRPLFLMHDHDGGGTCLTRVQSSMVLSAGKDGRVVLRDVVHYQCRLSALPPSKEKRKPVCSALARYSADGGVRSVCTAAHHNSREMVAVVAGRDAVVVRVQMANAREATARDRHAGDTAFAGAAANHRSSRDCGSSHASCAATSAAWCEPQWRVAMMQCDTARAPALVREHTTDAAVLRTRLTSTLQQLRHAWSQVMARCAVDVPVEELLLPDRRALFDAECDAAVAAMRTSAYYDELYSAYVQDVLRRHCCDTMDVCRSRLGALCTREVMVCNFAVRKDARAMQGLVRKVALLRRVQARVGAGRRPPCVTAPGGAATLRDAESDRSATADTIAAATTATTATATTDTHPRDDGSRRRQQQRDAVDGGACTALEQLLWPCTAVYTEARAAVQMMLLHGLTIALKDSYNARYNDVREWRRHVVSELRERNRRCAQIARQLGGAPAALFAIVEPCDGDGSSGDVQSLFAVRDDELPDELRALAARDSDAQRTRSDISVYAIADEAAVRLWMDGLEKDVQELRVTVQPPDFLDEARETYVPPDERSDAQVQQAEAYEKQLAEETAAVALAKEALRDEFAALQSANEQAARAVDDAVSQLRRARLGVCERVHAAELQLLATLQHRLVVHATRHRYRSLAREREDTQTRHCAAATHMHNRHATASQARAAYETLQQRNTNWLNALRGVSPFADAPHGDRLYRRLARWKHRLDDGHVVAPPPRDAPADDVTADAWSAYCGHCDAAIQLRDSLDDARTRAQQETSAYEAARLQCEAAAARVADVDAAMRQLRASHVRMLLDTPVLYQLRQGQLQDERAVTSSEVAEACLRWCSDVTQYNELIVASHAESSSLLQRGAQRQQRVKLLQWQRKRLEYDAATLAMELRQLHTLRVTRDMHDWLNGAAAVTEEAALQKVSRHMDLVNARMRGKVVQLSSTAAQLRAQIAERAGENAALAQRWQQLRSSVDDATAVKSVLDAHASESAQQARRVRELCTTSQLEHVARGQQQELLRLKAEVDRLRERTFPSFAVVSKHTA